MLLLPMRGFRISRTLLQFLFTEKSGTNEIEAYRFYLVARYFFGMRSSLFSIDEFLTVLQDYFDYTSLSHTGKRKNYYNKFQKLFRHSILFQECNDGRFYAKAEHKIIKKHRGEKYSYWFEAPLETIKRKGAFKDFCIGTVLAGNKFRSNSNVARQCDCSKRRIQYATKNNQQRKHFRKQFNFIQHEQGTFDDVTRIRAELYKDYGIQTPPPFLDISGRWVLILQAPNSYNALVTRRVKGHRTCPTGDFKKESQCWFIQSIVNLVSHNQLMQELRDQSIPVKRTWRFNQDAGWDYKKYRESNRTYAKHICSENRA